MSKIHFYNPESKPRYMSGELSKTLCGRDTIDDIVTMWDAPQSQIDKLPKTFCKQCVKKRQDKITEIQNGLCR